MLAIVVYVQLIEEKIVVLRLGAATNEVHSLGGSKGVVHKNKPTESHNIIDNDAMSDGILSQHCLVSGMGVSDVVVDSIGATKVKGYHSTKVGLNGLDGVESL